MHGYRELRSQGEIRSVEEVWRLAEQIHARPRQIHIRPMKSKMGSCSQRKVITFNSSVLTPDDLLRKEAIIHELLHLRYRSHGKMFKALLRAYTRINLSENGGSDKVT